jgi:Xaa-Pro aminopeptidase
MGYVNLHRVQTLLEQHRLDGLLVVSPENFEYFSGVSGFPVTMWRQAGPASSVVSANGDVAFVIPEVNEAAVRRANSQATIWSYPLWIEQIDVVAFGDVEITEAVVRATAGRENVRPETYDQKRLDDCLLDALGTLNLWGKRIGVELDFAPAAHFDHLRTLMPSVEFVNSSSLIRELRLIKTPQEIDILRRGVRLTEQGIVAALEGVTMTTLAQDIRARFSEACAAIARQQRELGFQGAKTTVHLGPWLWAQTDPNRPAHPGDLIQFDSSVQLHGYKTDIGRTFVLGEATVAQRRIQEALLAGFAAGREQLRPGRRFCDVFSAVQDAVRRAGFPSYARGHVGHSVGSDIDGEEWPWLSAQEERIIEPGMVLAFEVPYYVNGVGGFQNEDQFLITEDGHESFNTLPLEFTSVG